MLGHAPIGCCPIAALPDAGSSTNLACPTPVALATAMPNPVLSVLLAVATAACSITTYAPTLSGLGTNLQCPTPTAITTTAQVPTLNKSLDCPAPGRTNLCIYSEEISNAAWSKLRSGTANFPAVTADYAIAPDRTQTADRVILDVNGNTGDFYSMIYSPTITCTVGQKQTGSVWLKTNDASTVSVLVMTPRGRYEVKTVTGDWTRFSVTDTGTAADSGGLRISLNVFYGSSGYADLAVWGAQCENAEVATAYIKTTTAAASGPTAQLDEPPPSLATTLATPTPDRTNMLTNSVWAGGSPPTGWTLYQNAGTGSAAADTSTLDAGDGAAAYTITATTSYQAFFYPSVTVAANSVYAVSVLVESTTGTVSASMILSYTASPAGTVLSYPPCEANPTGGSGGTVGTGRLTALFSVAGTSGTLTPRIGLGAAAAVSGVAARISRPQIELRNAASDFIPTTTGSGPVTVSSLVTKERAPALAVSLAMPTPQLTNLFIYSQQLDLWGGNNSTVTADALAAPDGTTTADKLIAAAVSGEHYKTKSVTTQAKVYCYSAYAYAGEYTKLALQTNAGDGTYRRAKFDISGASLISSDGGKILDYKIESLGGGWVRVWIVVASDAASRAFLIQPLDAAGNSTFTGDGTSGIYVWGQQLEEGPAPTAYRPTGAATTTTETLVISGPAPTLDIQSSGTNLQCPTPVAITTNANAPALSATLAAPTPTAITTTEPTPTVQFVLNAPTPTAITTTEPTPTVQFVLNAPTPTAITTTEPTPTVQFNLACPVPVAITTAKDAPTLTIGVSLNCPTPTAITTVAPVPTLNVQLATPSATSVTITTPAPTLQIVGTINLQCPTPTAITTAEPTPSLAINLAAPAPTSIVTTEDAPSRGTSIPAPTPVSMATTGHVPTIVRQITLQCPAPTAISLLTPAPTLALGLQTPSPVAVTTATYAPSLLTGIVLQCPAPVAVVTSEPVPSLSINLGAQSAVANLTTHATSITALLRVPSPVALLTNAQAPTLAVNVPLVCPTPTAMSFISYVPTLTSWSVDTDHAWTEIRHADPRNYVFTSRPRNYTLSDYTVSIAVGKRRVYMVTGDVRTYTVRG